MMIIKTQVKPTDTWSKKFMQTLQNCYAQSQKRKLDVKTSIIYLNTKKEHNTHLTEDGYKITNLYPR